MASGEQDRTGSIERLDQALGELRFATFGFYGSRLRATLLDDVGWSLSVVHYRLLRTVESTEPARLTVTEVASALLTDKARASRLIDEVQRAGLVTRRTGRLDRRRREVELLDTGREALAGFRQARRDSLSALVAEWSDADLASFSGWLDRFNEAVRYAPERLSDATGSSTEGRP